MKTRACAAIVVMAWCFGGAPAAATGADVFPRYAEAIWLRADGFAHLDIDVDLPIGTPSPVRLPLRSGDITGLVTSGIDRAAAAVTAEAGRRYMSVSFTAPLTAPATLRVSFDAPNGFAAMQSPPKAFGNRTLTYRFLNSTPITFSQVTHDVILPPGFIVTAIDDSEPPADESSTAPPYALVTRDGRHVVRLAATNIGLGGVTSVTFRVKERDVSPLVPAALALVGVAYLIWFRNLIASPEQPS